MPSILEDPSTKTPPPSTATQGAMKLTPRKTHTSGSNHANAPSAPITLYPVTRGAASLPAGLVSFLHAEFNKEIQRGTTYPMETAFSLEGFAEYWFGTFGVVALLDGDDDEEEGDGDWDGLKEGRDWGKVCLGAFYIKPNYPGRCSHVCNAGFLTTTAARGKGVGVAMGETYLEFAPKLGYTFSVFNLVFENNTASTKIWDKLGFRVIGRVPGCARLENSDSMVDALIYGRELV